MREKEMDCQEIQELLTAYLDGEVTPEEKVYIEAHLADCSACRAELKAFSSIQRDLRSALTSIAEDAAPSLQVWEKIKDRLETKENRRGFRSNFTFDRVTAAATAIVVLAIAIAVWQFGGFFGGVGSPPPAPVEAPQASVEVTTPAATPAPTTTPATPAAPETTPETELTVPEIVVPDIEVPAPTTVEVPPVWGDDAITSTRVEPEPGDTIVSSSALMIHLDVEDLIAGADTIVTGRVVEILPAKQSDTIEWGGSSLIYTDVIIQVEYYLYGQPRTEYIAVHVWGGRIDGMVMWVEDMPEFNLGEEVFLFLARLSPENSPPEGIASEDYYQVYGSMQGKYDYDDDVITNLDGETFTLAEIAEKIADIRND